MSDSVSSEVSSEHVTREPAKGTIESDDRTKGRGPVHVIVRRFARLPPNVRGALTILLAAAFFAGMTLVIKLLGQGDYARGREAMNVTQILFLRQCGMTLMLLPQIVAHWPDNFRTNAPGWQAARVGFALIAMTCGFTAVINMPLADATAIGFAKSFFTTAFAILILGEVVGWRRWTATFVGFLGVLVMIRPFGLGGSEGVSPYAIYALAGAAAAGLVMVIIRRLSRTDSNVTILTFQAVFVGLAMAVPAFVFWVWPTPAEWALVAALGVLSIAGQWLNIQAYRVGEASVMAVLDYARLIYATLLGWLVFATLPDAWTWVGAAIVVAAAVYIVYREAVRRQVILRGPGGKGYTG